MKALIIEDEEPASKRLQKLLFEIDPSIEILETIVSVVSAIKWFRENPPPDIVFSDIQLADGTSFEIFKAMEMESPVVFTTAFNQYAIDAFKVNSIDYLLKPIKKDALLAAIEKFKKRGAVAISLPDINKLMKSLQLQGQAFKKRFVVRYGEHIKTINIEDVAFFYTEDKINFLTTKEGRRFTIDYNLDSLESMLDPKNFFRINRQYIISIHSIKEMFAYTKSRVLIKLNPEARHETIVSTERSADFKLWLGDE
jgi:two-component system LytT family response regulator